MTYERVHKLRLHGFDTFDLVNVQVDNMSKKYHWRNKQRCIVLLSIMYALSLFEGGDIKQ